MPDKPPYIGRFAPSPTGSLHFGSLYTALASFLAAKSQQGLWCLRIDDLDAPRNKKGAVNSILTTLDAFGLYWDASVVYQSQCLDAYSAALDQLDSAHLIYPCTCSRKTLTTVYSGLCRHQVTLPASPYALRLKTDNRLIIFDDLVQGLRQQNVAEYGDFIIKRKDHIFAYQFAVVIDDHLQHANHVLRGCDLLAETPRQIYQQQLLGLVTPTYLHVPIIVDEQGYKLSKQTHATAVEAKQASALIFELLTLLKQNPPKELHNAPVTELLSWGIAHWQSAPLKNCRTVCRRK